MHYNKYIHSFIGGTYIHKSFHKAEQEICRIVGGLFNTLNIKFSPKHNEIILSLQYYKPCRCDNENAEEWMIRFYIMTVE